MPEGDTLWRTARTLQAGLAGHTLTAFAAQAPALEAAAHRARLVGRQVLRVESRGKHLLVHFEGGLALHTHLGLHGSWRLCRPAEGGLRAARVRLETAQAVALCYRAGQVELLSARELHEHAVLRALGPDLLAPDFGAERRSQARLGLRLLDGEEIGVALLDQRALAGIGNVYKSEVLFACRVDPRARVAALDDATLDLLIDCAQRLLRRNLVPGPRRTTPLGQAGPLWVYGRARRPCRRCGTPIRRCVQGGAAAGRLPRSTYFCPRCQPPHDGAAAAGFSR